LAASGPMQLRYPSGWQPTTSAPAIPGMTFTNPIALAPNTAAGALSAGEADAGGPTLLPAAFRARVSGTLPAGRPVRVGVTPALRYANLRVNGLDGTVTVYAAPTTGGVATLVCHAPSTATTSTATASFTDECAQIADTLRLVGVTAYPLGPSAG